MDFDDRPSRTAQAVAFARSVGHRGATPDPEAARLLPPRLERIARWTHRSGAGRRLVRGLANRALFGHLDHIGTRTAVFDQLVMDGVAAGLDTLLLLGAGFDLRAWRLPLASVRVLEGDLAQTQHAKRAFVDGLAPPKAASVAFQPLDLTRPDTVDAALAAEDLSTPRPLIVLCEGVSMYLPPETVEALVHRLADLAAPGSRLGFTYVVTPPALTLLQRGVRSLLGGLGEPLASTWTPDDFGRLLARTGWQLDVDDDALRWSERLALGPLRTGPWSAERFAVATRVAP